VQLSNVSIVPPEYIEKDPRTLLFHAPDIPPVVYAKKMQVFTFYYAVKAAENASRAAGFMLVPSSCMNWYRKQKLADNRKVAIGRNAFFMMRESEMTNTERKKLLEYLQEEGIVA